MTDTATLMDRGPYDGDALRRQEDTPPTPEPAAGPPAPAPSPAPAPAPAPAPSPAPAPPTEQKLHPPDPTYGIHSSNFRFPDGFLWGASTSAHQVEGNNVHNDWWAWEQAGKVATPSGRAASHYEHYQADLEMARDLEHNAHRFSLEWSRIEPEEGRFDPEAIEHYADVLRTLLSLGIEPVVTLHHYTLPLWLAAKGGWESKHIERYFARFVKRVLLEYGPMARYWITLNEPVVHVFKSYLIGQWPPGKQDWPAALKVLRHMLRAHVRAYHIIHSERPDAMVSIAKHALALTPDDPHSWRDRLSVRVRHYLFNHLFVDALHSGVLRVPGLFWERLPAGRTLDFIGVNYYTRDFVRNTGFDLPGLAGASAQGGARLQHIGKLNDLGWEVYPEGLAMFLREYSRYKLPILITENGVPAREDDDRWVFLYMHLWQVARAIADGVNVIGYLHWSLLDNYEWADGYRARFGLIEVDFDTQQRRIRPSAWKYAHIIRSNEL